MLKKIDRYKLNYYLNSDICRRQILNGYLDPDRVAGCSRNDIFCDICERKQTNTDKTGEKTPISNITNIPRNLIVLNPPKTRETGLKLSNKPCPARTGGNIEPGGILPPDTGRISDKINIINLSDFNLRLIDYSQNYCFLCLFNKRYSSAISGHNTGECRISNPSLISKRVEFIVEKTIDLIVKKRALKRGSACYKCWLPSKICYYNREISPENKCGIDKRVLLYIYFLIKSENNNINFNSNIFDYFNSEENINIDYNEIIEEISSKSRLYETEAIKLINIILDFDIFIYIENNKDIETINISSSTSSSIGSIISNSSGGF